MVGYVTKDWPKLWLFPKWIQDLHCCKARNCVKLPMKFSKAQVSASQRREDYLGGAIGTTSFRNQLIEQKVREWVEEIKTLSEISKTEPHAAFAAFTHGLSSGGTTSYGSRI